MDRAQVAMPWEGLRRLADGRSLSPAEGDWRIDRLRFRQVAKDGRRLEPSAGWTWNRRGHYGSNIPGTFTFVRFSREKAGH